MTNVIITQDEVDAELSRLHRKVKQPILQRPSKYRNVGWNIEKQKWMARLWRDSRYYFLGYFDDEKEAHDAIVNFNVHTFAVNRAARIAQKTCKHVGVYRDESRQIWVAKYSNKYLGRFSDINDAIAARQKYETKIMEKRNEVRNTQIDV